MYFDYDYRRFLKRPVPIPEEVGIAVEAVKAVIDGHNLVIHNQEFVGAMATRAARHEDLCVRQSIWVCGLAAKRTWKGSNLDPVGNLPTDVRSKTVFK